MSRTERGPRLSYCASPSSNPPAERALKPSEKSSVLWSGALPSICTVDRTADGGHSERYRDLLSAADSIVRMRTSATTLLGRLEVAQHDCTHDELSERARVGRESHPSPSCRAILIWLAGRSNRAAAGGTRTPYTTATLVKLLLDSPEHVWRAIERHHFLAAARLEAVARAVYRALAGSVDRHEDADDGDELTVRLYF